MSRFRPRHRRLRERPSGWAFLRDLPRVLPYLRPYKALAAGSLAAMTAAAATSLVAPWPLAILVDSVLGNKPLSGMLHSLTGTSRDTLLALCVVGGLLVVALQNGLGVAQNYVDTKLEQHMSLDFRTDLFAHVQKLSFAYHDAKSTGMMMFQIVSEATTVGSITIAIPPLIESFATIIGMFIIAYLIDPTLALLALGVVPFVYYSTGFYLRRIQPQIYTVRGLEGQTQSIIVEGLSMLRVIVAFGRERHEADRLRRQGEIALAERVKLTVRQAGFSLAVNLVTAAGTAAVLYVGAHHVLQHSLTVGELLVLLGYIAAIYQPLHQISSSLSSLQTGFAAFRFALDILDEEPDIVDSPGGLEIGRARGDVAFENVSFTHRGRDRTLDDISFHVPAGTRIGVVGATGAGKTTLVSLIPRFYDPDSGRITLDGHDIRDIRLESMRRQVSIVFQEPLLFSDNLADNIRYGRLEATDEEVDDAARAASAREFIMALPEGYSTVVGERGAQLSGGERQRISIARAFLKDAPILILDEPTSSIDTKTEGDILDALDALMEGRTTFVIAHRLSTLRDVDWILVVDDGRIIEQGTRDDLILAGGAYARLLARQSQEPDAFDESELQVAEPQS